VYKNVEKLEETSHSAIQGKAMAQRKQESMQERRIERKPAGNRNDTGRAGRQEMKQWRTSR
jgi:hypothetical protein